MLIKSITMNNFRQFKGKQLLEFSTDNQKNVTVLLGDNTFGKTTILQAFNWCLYGKADFPKDSNPEFLLNLEIADQLSGIQQKCDVYVELNILHKNIEYFIKRTEVYLNQGYDNWNQLTCKLTISYKENGILKQVREGEESGVINEILPKSLSGYFFFDTERVADISGRTDLSEAVKGLLGLAAVGNARKHLGSRTLKTTAIGKWNEALDSLGDEKAKGAQNTIDRESEKIENLKEECRNAKKELETLNAQKEKIAEFLRQNQDTSMLQKQKQDKEREMEEEKNELKSCNELFLNSFNNGAVTYCMSALMQQTHDVLKRTKIDEKGIADMTSTSIMELIKRGHCVCGAPIVVEKEGESGNDAYMHLLEELRYLPPEHIGSAVRNFKQLLANENRGAEHFYPNLERIYKEIQRHRSKISVLDDEITRIDSAIFGKEDMTTYEVDMNRIREDIRRMNEKEARCNREIGASEKTIDSAQKEYDSLVATSERNKRLIVYLAYAEKICQWIDETYVEKEADMRARLENRVNDIFTRMYHGERRVKIDKQYHVTLFANINGKEVVSGESEGLKRVKNFAFIAGLVDLAKEKASLGKNASDTISWENEAYPLVMDAPFSNADETHIKNISEVLPEVANQVIMFVMEKDWQYARTVMEAKVGKYCTLKKYSESHTEIQD